MTEVRPVWTTREQRDRLDALAAYLDARGIEPQAVLSDLRDAWDAAPAAEPLDRVGAELELHRRITHLEAQARVTTGAIAGVAENVDAEHDARQDLRLELVGRLEALERRPGENLEERLASLERELAHALLGGIPPARSDLPLEFRVDQLERRVPLDGPQALQLLERLEELERVVFDRGGWSDDTEARLLRSAAQRRADT